jgi:hypothetical protein
MHTTCGTDNTSRRTCRSGAPSQPVSCSVQHALNPTCKTACSMCSPAQPFLAAFLFMHHCSVCMLIWRHQESASDISWSLDAPVVPVTLCLDCLHLQQLPSTNFVQCMVSGKCTLVHVSSVCDCCRSTCALQLAGCVACWIAR